MGHHARSPALARKMRFAVLFVGLLLALAAGFVRFEDLFTRLYLWPMSGAAASALDGIGIPTRLDADQLASGYCLLRMERAIFRVIPECTGIFTLLTLLAALIAYPAPAGRRALGATAAVFAFFGYGVGRLVLLGVLGHTLPGLLSLVHVWLLSLVNLAFAGLLWRAWIDRVVAPS